MRKSLFIIFTYFIPFIALGKVETWKIDPSHSSANFEIKHLAISTVEGSFKDVGGTVTFGIDEFKTNKNINEIKFDLWTKTESITTNNEKRDAHLKTADFFNVKKKENEKISFQSTDVKKTSGDNFLVTGLLTMNNVKKPVTFEGTYHGTMTAFDKKRIGMTLSTEIKRSKWNISWNDVVEATPLVGEDVQIKLSIQAHRDAS